MSVLEGVYTKIQSRKSAGTSFYPLIWNIIRA